jgi:hypothetical protein
VNGRSYLERHRVDLAESTLELDEHLFSKHTVPSLGATAVGGLATEAVENWFGELRAGAASTAAKAYRLLRQMVNSAVEDGLRIDNPCLIKNGGTEPEANRPEVSLSEVAALAEPCPESCSWRCCWPVGVRCVGPRSSTCSDATSTSAPGRSRSAGPR